MDAFSPSLGLRECLALFLLLEGRRAPASPAAATRDPDLPFPLGRARPLVGQSGRGAVAESCPTDPAGLVAASPELDALEAELRGFLYDRLSIEEMERPAALYSRLAGPGPKRN
ncbi:MAG: hypothetical protein JNG85_05605 [Spirochaetaceae bacterium]|nr:hypothetical protein [Spirochaetaceae bacterium]